MQSDEISRKLNCKMLKMNAFLTRIIAPWDGLGLGIIKKITAHGKKTIQQLIWSSCRTVHLCTFTLH